MITFKLPKRVFTFILLASTPIILYVSTAFLLAFFPNQSTSPIKKEKKIYLIYDNVHSDIVFNLEGISDQWIKNLPIIKNKKKGYIAFGWGDKETYLNTPTWNKVKVSTSLKALFINTPSLVHVSYYSDINYFIGVKSIEISETQNQQIKKSILKSFNFQKNSYQGYGYDDIFYDSPYKYNFIYTCNTWTGDILRDANILMSYWTPFSRNIIHSLP